MLHKRVFITGINGFTGNYLDSELSSHGYDVFGTVYHHSKCNEKQFYCDILDTEKLTGLIKKIRPDYIINLAGISFVKHTAVTELYKTNQLGVLSLLEAVSASNHLPLKILLPSSAHVYGNQTSSPIQEQSSTQPNSHYAISKLAMEKLASLWFDRLPIILARPFNYTGVGQSMLFLPPKIIKHFKEKAPSIKLGNIDVARDWSDVRDIVKIYQKLLESDQKSLVLNICSGQSYTLENILNCLSELSGHSIKVEVDEKFIRSNEIKKLDGDNSLLYSVIKKEPTHNLSETLHWMLMN